MSLTKLIVITIIIGSGFLFILGGLVLSDESILLAPLIIGFVLLIIGFSYLLFWKKAIEYMSRNSSKSHQTLNQSHKTFNQCFKCGKKLRIGGGFFIGSGSDLVAHLSNNPYNCESCGTAFCVDCMAILKKGLCPKCGNNIGW